ncbi:DUF2171 domain-containing protein [Paracraurococcus ruber]|uniref:DUF2171 domain-containing protein n=1 Tax=Paracraurococcus ruber TaxID=77675 RepID=A0ABS1CY37_9PROT|nr:DUF2171 domain-containing protein [Paracraurococcus ruber]MBK1659444.1 hypothetical protein [Paracraurococcus ruber]TDG31158.1 DUF2171 domain-containing protein [Paracraurococcus ruber]
MSGNAAQVKEHMEVVGSDGKHVGTVDHLDGDRIKLTKKDDPDGSGQHHHYIPVSAIAAVEGGKVTLSMPADRAKAQATGTGGPGQGPGMSH